MTTATGNVGSAHDHGLRYHWELWAMGSGGAQPTGMVAGVR